MATIQVASGSPGRVGGCVKGRVCVGRRVRRGKGGGVGVEDWVGMGGR